MYKLTERRKKIYLERKKGKTFREIGKELGISGERVGQLFKTIESKVPKEELEKIKEK